MWYLQKSPLVAKSVNILKKCPLFADVTEQSIYFIAHNLAKEKVARDEVKVYSMMKQSPFYKSSLNPSLNREGIPTLENTYIKCNKLHQIVYNALLNQPEELYVIVNGKCSIRHPQDNYAVGQVGVGEFFGESELLGEMGYDYFGDIIADRGATFLCIKGLKRVVAYDLKQVKENAKKHKRKLIKMIFACTKLYGGNPYKI